MATIGNTYLDLIDLYKAENKNRDIIPVIEALHQLNPLMEDAYIMECNEGRGHTSAIRTGLPAVSWGALYEGTPQSKSTRQQVTDTTGFVEGQSEVDTRLLKLAKNPGLLRMQEAEAFLESISQEVQSSFFYADTAITPRKFKGLAARYNKLPGASSAPATNQVVSAGGSGSDNTSIWFVTWGANQTGLIYPEGTSGGIQREDKGEQPAFDANGDRYFVKLEQFTQHVGVRVGDWRWNARVCNIDVSDALAGNVDVYDFMTTAYYRLQGRRNAKIRNGGMVSPGRTVIYMNRTMLEVLDKLATNNGASDNFVRLKPVEIEGREIMTWRGMPIRETDALLNTEAAVTA